MIRLLLIIIGILLISLVPLASPKTVYGSFLHESIEETYTHEVAYVSPSEADLKRAKKLFYSLFLSADFKVDPQAWDSLGFETERIGIFLVLKEKNSAQTGKGLYIFNTTKPSQVIIEAPHRPSDLLTETIAIQLIEDGNFLAAGLNTVHRKKANFTREEMTYFNAFTEAFGEAYPQGNVIQLHGFDDVRHKALTDLIFSATVLSPPPLFYQYGECLKSIPLRVTLFPNNIGILGGTKNINAIKFRESGTKGLFLHLEMGLKLREKLKTHKEFRDTFFGCFIETK